MKDPDESRRAATEAAWAYYHPDEGKVKAFATHVAHVVVSNYGPELGPFEGTHKALECAWKIGFYCALQSFEAGWNAQREQGMNN